MADDDEFFSDESLVILTSNTEVDAFEWSEYIENHWDDLKQRNAKILILAGIHGNPDGKLGNEDNDLLEDYQRQIDYFTGDECDNLTIKNDIENFNIKVSITYLHLSFLL